MASPDIDALDDNPVITRDDAKHFADLSSIIAGRHNDRVTFYVRAMSNNLEARDTIFM